MLVIFSLIPSKTSVGIASPKPATVYSETSVSLPSLSIALAKILVPTSTFNISL